MNFKKHVAGSVVREINKVMNENYDDFSQYYDLTLKRFSQMLKIDEEKTSIFKDVYSTMKAIFDAYSLNGRKVYCFPNYNTDLLSFITEQDYKFYDLKLLFTINEKSIGIEDNSVFIIGSYFSKTLEISEQFLTLLKSKGVFIIQFMENYEFNTQLYNVDVVVLHFDKRNILFIEEIVFAITNNQIVDLYPFATGGYVRDKERLFIYKQNVPTVLSQAVFNGAIGNINEYFKFQNTTIEIFQAFNKRNVKVVGHFILAKTNKELKHFVSFNITKFFPAIKFPQKFMQIAKKLKVCDIHFWYPYKHLDEIIKSINSLKESDYEDI